MAKFSLIFLLFLTYTNSVSSQDYRLVNVLRYDDNSKDFKKTGFCFDKKVIINDTLIIQLYVDNSCKFYPVKGDSFSFYNDTISLNDISNIIAKDSVYFDPIKNRMDTVVKFNISVTRDMWDKYQGRIYKLVGFQKVPSVIQFNHALLCDCSTKPLKFDIYNQDTINVINSNGRKNGLWIRFYDTGEIQEKKYYNNGKFIYGTTYDKSGKDLHVVREFENGSATINIEPQK